MRRERESVRACLPFLSSALIDQPVPQIDTRKEKQVLTNFLFGAGSAPSAREQTDTGEVKITAVSRHFGPGGLASLQKDMVPAKVHPQFLKHKQMKSHMPGRDRAIDLIFMDNSHITT